MKKLLASLGILVVAMSTVAMAHDHQMWNMNGDWDTTFTCTEGCSGDYNHIMSIVNYAALDPVIDTDETSGQFSGTGYYCTNTNYTWDVTGKLNLDDTVNFHIVYTKLNPGYYSDVAGTMVAGSQGLMMEGTWLNPTQSGTFTAKTACDNIMDQTVYYKPTHYYSRDQVSLVPIKDGVDDFGYDYNAHRFEGYYANAYLGGDGLPPYDGYADKYELAYPEVLLKGYWPYKNLWLVMEWNDAWLSNKDCGKDGTSALNTPDTLIDRHYGFPGYKGSGAWLTNEISGKHNYKTTECQAYAYTEMMAVPSTAKPCALDSTLWCESDSTTVIGPAIWGDFAIVQEEQINSCGKKVKAVGV